MTTDWETSSSSFKSFCAVPKEFEGSGTSTSPEDFYLMALQNCFMATFKVYAQYSKLSFEKLDVKTELIVDLNESKKPCMKEIQFKIDVFGASDLKKAQLLVNKTLENGFILQSVKTTITSTINFS